MGGGSVSHLLVFYQLSFLGGYPTATIFKKIGAWKLVTLVVRGNASG